MRELRSDFFSDKELTAEFIRFTIEIFGLDFTKWREAGYLDSDFRAFSYFEQAKMIACTNVYSHKMCVEGEEKQIAQFSTVGTNKDHRKKGLNRQLTEEARKWADPIHDFYFLFADDDAVPFYLKLGYKPAKESTPVVPAPKVTNKTGIRKLDISNMIDLKLIETLARARTMVSDKLGVNTWKLLMFHAMYTLRDNAYYIAELETIIFYKQHGDRVKIFDVVAKKMPSFDELYSFLDVKDAKDVAFHFVPDKLSLKTPVNYEEFEHNELYVCDRFKVEEPFIFPFTSHA